MALGFRWLAKPKLDRHVRTSLWKMDISHGLKRAWKTE